MRMNGSICATQHFTSKNVLFVQILWFEFVFILKEFWQAIQGFSVRCSKNILRNNMLVCLLHADFLSF